MKAAHWNKTSEVIENIYKRISEANANGEFKIFYPHFVYIKDDVKMQLISDGYKVYVGDWDGIIINALIIEW